MRGLEQINRMNDQEAALFQQKRYEKLREKSIKRGDWDRAKRYDGFAQDFRLFVAGLVNVYPSKKNAKAAEFVPSVGRDFCPRV